MRMKSYYRGTVSTREREKNREVEFTGTFRKASLPSLSFMRGCGACSAPSSPLILSSACWHYDEVVRLGVESFGKG